MGYAEVSVNSPVAQRQTFSYAVPPGLEVQVGQAVWVPFGERVLQGIVLKLTDCPSVTETREIAGVIEPRPLLSRWQVALAQWISDYYLAPLFSAVALMLPPGFERRSISYVWPTQVALEYGLPVLTAEQEQALSLIRRQGKTNLKELEKSFGVGQTRRVIAQLLGRGLVAKDYELEAVKVKPKKVRYLRLVVTPERASEEASRLYKSGQADQQARLLDFLSDRIRPVPVVEARKAVGCSPSVVEALVSKGLAAVEVTEVKRRPVTSDGASLPPLSLSAAQEAALSSIRANLSRTTEGDTPAEVWLLHGVTGSGKTEVYLQALAEAVKRGKRGIVLVPEISLTPQTIERFTARFPDRVAVLHSKLSLGERFDEWRRIRDGQCDVVIGPRSALFAPQPDLGLVVIDEEHEWTYKQQDKSPRYQARRVAIKLAELTGATVILGTATPDVETFYHAQRGDYRLLSLPERVVPEVGSAMPQVEVVDLKEELKAGNRSIFSRSLSQAINGAVARREQVILFLNRRGGATFVQCRSCGFVLRCRRCEVPLTYHPDQNVLVCHQCNYRTPMPRVCPDCLSQRIKFLGLGTQRLEQEVGRHFPQARVLRWDSDVTRGKDAHQKVLAKFRAHDADILIGTQMIAKGLDLPLVTLVGVINADLSLNLPDFRAGEKTFQLISQVLGRAGRGTSGGRVIVQSYCPEHYSVQAAARHDYHYFYAKEIAYRRQLRNPPFAGLARLVYSHPNDLSCQREAARLRQVIIEEIASRGIDDLGVLGPAPAFIHRLRGRFRWQLVLRGTAPSAFLTQILIPPAWTIDIDPIGLV